MTHPQRSVSIRMIDPVTFEVVDEARGNKASCVAMPIVDVMCAAVVWSLVDRWIDGGWVR